MFWLIVLLIAVYKLAIWALSTAVIESTEGKHVLITGCDTGFGNQLAKHLDSLGFSVFASCLTSEGAENLQRECSEKVITFQLDVSRQNSIDNARQFVENILPPGTGLWGLVNNAGVMGVAAPTEWVAEDEWMRCLSVNLLGVVNTTRTFLPLVRQAQGRVVNVSCLMGRFPAASAPYCVSKYGVEAFSDCLRHETYDQGITVCLLEPGFYRTEMLNVDAMVGKFQQNYAKIPDHVKQPYNGLTVEKYRNLAQQVHDVASEDVGAVVDALTLALTSKFPPTRQLVGLQAYLVGPVLWNMPDPIMDWILNQFIRH